METFLGKTEVSQNWFRWYYNDVFESFSEIISTKSGKNYEKILGKNVGITSHKLYKKHLDGNFVKFSR